MDLLVGVPLFFIVLWLTATTFARKGWPVWLGILIGVVLQWVGRILALLVTLGTAAFGEVPFAITFTLAPLLGSLLPIVVAVMIPYTKREMVAETTSKSGSVACPKCGRFNAATTRVCPRCGERIGDDTQNV